MLYRILDKIDKIKPFPVAKAHCDIPCGIYDPFFAQVAALTVIRMVDLIDEASEKKNDDKITRCILVKEDHAEKCKREVRILFGDYFKPEHIERYPELSSLTYSILQSASHCKQETSREKSVELLKQINRLAEIYWNTKNIKFKRVRSPYEVKEEIVVPEL
jgi:nickel superoxide dismutase